MKLAALLLFVAATAHADPAAFVGSWDGPWLHEGRSVPLTLQIDSVTDGVVRGRMLQAGEEYAPISEGKIDGNAITFRLDTIMCNGVFDGDHLALTLSISHGRTFTVAMTRKSSQARSSGALLLAGGGTNAPEILERFIQLAGGAGAPIVVIPTAEDERRLTAERLEYLRKRHGEMFTTDDVAVLHTRDRAVADSAEFVKPLQRARGVWMMGGDTGELLRAYRGTRTERELKAVVARGGVVGGTSAGAIVQTNDLLSSDGKREPGFGLLSGVLLWPHWSERRVEDALAKYAAQLGDVTGIGIDEATAIVVRGDSFEVVGEGSVGIVDGKEHDGKRYYRLHRGDRLELRRGVPSSR